MKTIIPTLTDEQAWAMLGATPDIGKNDDTEVFTLADAQTLTDFAIQKKLGLITFWNIQRDQTCGKGECSQNDKAISTSATSSKRSRTSRVDRSLTVGLWCYSCGRHARGPDFQMLRVWRARTDRGLQLPVLRRWHRDAVL